MAHRLSHQRRALLAALPAVLAGCGLARAPGTMPVPQLPAVIQLRPAYFHNPRFARADAQVQASVLAHAVRMAREYLGLALEFTPVREIDIAQAFAAYGPPLQARVDATLYDFKGGRGDRARLVAGTQRRLESSGSTLDDMLRYAEPHLLKRPATRSFSGLAEAAVDTQLVRLELWRKLVGEDGSALLDARHYNEFNAWIAAAAVPASQWTFEVVLTNQLLASAEYDSNDLHGALRGGVSNGLCAPAPDSRYGTVSVLSLYPFTSNDEAIMQLRGGVRAEGGAPAAWAAALLVHELGHQLLHLNHPFARTACVMNPPPLLLFPQWVAGLDGRACPIGSAPEMKPGAVKFPLPGGAPGTRSQSM